MDRTREGYPDIAVYGKMGAGKTTVATILEHLGYQHEAFAGTHPGGVRDIVARLYGRDEAQDRTTIRTVAEALHAVDNDVWINPLLRVLDQRDAWDTPAVVDDMRRAHEWRALHSHGFLIVRVTAPEWLRVDRLKKSGKWRNEADLHHVTELMLDGRSPDHTIDNGPDVSIEALHERVADIVRWERKKRS